MAFEDSTDSQPPPGAEIDRPSRLHQKSFPANEKALSGRESLSLICAKPAGAHFKVFPY